MARIFRALAAGGLAVALAGCWYQPGQGPNRAGYNPFETEIDAGNVDDLAVQWVAETDGTNVQDPVVSNRGVHVADYGQKYYGFDVASGERLWAHDVAIPGTFPLALGPTVSDGNRVLVSSGLGNLGGHWSHTWLDAATGADVGGGGSLGLVESVRGTRSAWMSVGFGSGTPAASVLKVVDSADPAFGWSGLLSFTNSVAPPVTLGPAAVYQAGWGINGPPGSPSPSGNAIRSFPLTEPARCVPQSSSFVCPQWATPLPGSDATQPILGEGEAVVYSANDLGTLYAVSAADGALLWSSALGAAPTGTPALAEGVVYVPTTAGLVAVDADGCGAATCSRLWTGSGAAVEQPAVAGGVVFVAGADGSVHAFDADGCGAATCSSLWSSLIGSPITGAPAVTGGQLYVGTQDGRLIAYGLD